MAVVSPSDPGRGHAARRLPVLASTPSRARGVTLLPAVGAADRRARPVHAVWELTLRCNLGCVHCGSRAGHARPDELDTPEALELVGQLADLGVREVTLIGGEAFLHPGWQDVVRRVRALGMSCAIVTGGRGVDAVLAQQMAAAGVQSLSVSIDGDRDVHDELRGSRGAYDAARSALRHAASAGMQVALNSQINRRNRGLLDHLAGLLVEHGCHGWQVQFTVPAGRASDRPDLLLQPPDLLTLLPRLVALRQYCEQHGIKFLPGNNVGYFGPHEHALRGHLRRACQAECGAGRLVIGIEANGDIKGCPSLRTHTWVGGNVRDHSLRDIWQRTPQLRALRERSTTDLWGYCAQCYYAETCKGGCTWTAESFMGRPGNNPYCHHRALEHERRGLRERVVWREGGWGEAFDHGRWEILVESEGTVEQSV